MANKFYSVSKIAAALVVAGCAVVMPQTFAATSYTTTADATVDVKDGAVTGGLTTAIVDGDDFTFGDAAYSLTFNTAGSSGTTVTTLAGIKGATNNGGILIFDIGTDNLNTGSIGAVKVLTSVTLTAGNITATDIATGTLVVSATSGLTASDIYASMVDVNGAVIARSINGNTADTNVLTLLGGSLAVSDNIGSVKQLASMTVNAGGVTVGSGNGIAHNKKSATQHLK